MDCGGLTNTSLETGEDIGSVDSLHGFGWTYSLPGFDCDLVSLLRRLNTGILGGEVGPEKDLYLLCQGFHFGIFV